MTPYEAAEAGQSPAIRVESDARIQEIVSKVLTAEQRHLDLVVGPLKDAERLPPDQRKLEESILQPLWSFFTAIRLISSNARGRIRIP
jgi:hypothetical protein